MKTEIPETLLEDGGTPPNREITIIGGGLAGLTLGIALRQRDVPVTVLEAGTYPRHRVCGEFISGRGLEVLQDLGLREKLIAAGALEARTAAFHSGGRGYPVKMLPTPALCLSREFMDALLADEFRRLNGNLREAQRFTGANQRAGTVRATGRRIGTGRSEVNWIGLKAHARRAALDADLEMHFVPDGYVGLCRLAGGVVNVCGLFAARGPVPELAKRWPEFLRGPAGSVLRERLQHADFVPDSFCAVSGLNLRPSSAVDLKECCVGDALSMIPPLTGNGMSMAFESAAWAAGPLAAFSRGEASWDEARRIVARRCDDGFASRLRWASWLQALLLRRSTRSVMLRLTSRCDWLWRAFFAKTR